MLEAIASASEIAGRELDWTYTDDNRIGDHIWWIGDLSAFEADHPEWQLRYDVEAILRDIYEANARALAGASPSPRARRPCGAPAARAPARRRGGQERGAERERHARRPRTSRVAR